MRNHHLFKTLSIVALFTLGACAGGQDTQILHPTVLPLNVSTPIIHPPRTRPIELLQLPNEPWAAYTKGEQLPATSFCVSPTTYGIMGQNETETTRYINDQNTELKYYHNLK